MGNSKQDVKNVVSRSYLNKDRNAFKALLLQHARSFFADKIKDFSEASMGGLLLDMAAEIGDNMSFYLDHQFTELDAELAVETRNIQRHIRAAGVPITGASPAVVNMTWAVEVPAQLVGSVYVPQASALPTIQQGSVVESDDGVQFELVEDIDFSSTHADGTFKAKMTVASATTAGAPLSFIMVMGGTGNAPAAPDGTCVSGIRTSESFVIPNVHVPFRELTLTNDDVTEIVSVTDLDGNVYYEVESLTHDTVFRAVANVSGDSDLVTDNLEVIPAPYRYTRSTDFDTGLTTLRFGSGNAQTLVDDIIPDPSELALPLYGKTTFSRFTLDPNKLLGTQTLGVAPINTTIVVDYRSGGGLSHNVAAQTIRTVNTLRMTFAGAISSALATQIRASVAVRNVDPARGGEDAPTLDELRSKIPAARNAQGRIVTKTDMLARVYTMPSNFGRVYRAGIRSSQQNPLATQLFIVSRDADGKLVVSPDALKKNLMLFLNEFRMISDAVDILDAAVVNIGVEFKIVTEQNATKNIVVQDILTKLAKFFDVKNFQIDQPIKVDDVSNIIYNTPGVASVVDIRFKNIVGTVLDREYSNVKFDVSTNMKKKFIVPPPGAIFEVRYAEFDILGSAS